MAVKSLGAIIDFHAGAKVIIDLLPVWVIRIAEITQRLFQDGSGRNQPHNRLGFHHTHGIKDVLHGCAGKEGLTTTSGNLEAHMRNVGQHIIVGRQAAETNIDGL